MRKAFLGKALFSPPFGAARHFPPFRGTAKVTSVCVQNVADSLQNCAIKALPRNAGKGGASAPGGGKHLFAKKNFTHTETSGGMNDVSQTDCPERGGSHESPMPAASPLA